MRSRHALLLGLALALVLSARAQEKGAKDKTVFFNASDVNAEVAVLNVLHTLQPTPAQQKAMARVAEKTMQKPPARKGVKVTAKLRAALVALRDALAAGDEETIPELFKAYDELRDKEAIDFDDIEITKAARAEAPRLLNMLTARQVAFYVSSVEEFPDPVERLAEALEESQQKKNKEWQAIRDDAAYQVGWLVSGLNEEQENKTRDRATTLLTKAHSLEQKEYEAQKAALLKEARLIAKIGPTEVIRNFMERVLAETLSSHRLEAALKARAK